MQRQAFAFANTNNYPVSFFIKGIQGKVLLYERQQIRDREGNPIIPPESEWQWLIARGVKPVYIDIGEEKPLADRDTPVEVILDGVKLLEAKSAAEAQNLVSEFLTPGTVLPSPEESGEETITLPPVSHLRKAG
jgi:hypothetical protein